MSRIEKYANWLTENQDKKGTEDFEKVANAYKALRSQKSELKTSSFKDLLQQSDAEKFDEGFDYETGAPSGIRALVSFGETEEEKEAILLKKLGKDAYTKDSKGRLALTPQGQSKVGMKPSDKNIVLEEKGTSWGDVADLAGILPETVGSVAGGILGLGAGPLGLFTGALGAGAGAAAGQAVEEGIESLLGVQKQTLPEIGKDLAKEAALAGIVDFATIGTFRAGRAVIGAGAKRMSGDPLDAVRGADLVKRGYKPSLERLGAPAPLAYSQKFAEGATKDYQRIINNTNLAFQEKEKLLQTLADLDAAGQSFASVAGPRYQQLVANLNKSRESALNAVQDSIDVLEKGVKGDFDIDEVALKSIRDSFKNFQDVANTKYKAMDDALEKLNKDFPGTFRSDVRFIDTESLKNLGDQTMQRVVNSLDPSLLEPQVGAAIRRIQALRIDDGTYRATFDQLSNQRKQINDILFYGTSDLSSEGRTQLTGLLDEFDRLLSADHLKGLKFDNPRIAKQLKEIGKLRDEAAVFYKEGRVPFDDLEKLGIIRNVRETYYNQGKFDTDKFFDKVIKDNSPQRLKTILDSLTTGKIVKGKPEINAVAREELRSQLARSYLDNALGKTNLDLFNPTMFNGKAFRNHIHKLGTTGKELFGDRWGDVQKLADTIGQTSLTNIDDVALQNIVRLNANKGIINTMEDLAKATKEFQEANSISVVKKFNDGTLTAEDAAREMIRTNITSSEVTRLQRFFGNNPTELETIKQAVVTDLFGSVGDDIFTSPAKSRSLLDAMNKYRPGVLEKIIGKDHYKVVEQFAKDLVYLGDVGKEGSIYAATFAAHPIAKLPANVRMKGMASLFASDFALKLFAKTGTPNQRLARTMNILGRVTSGIARTTSGTRQLGAQAIAEQVGETTEEIKRQFTPAPVISSPNNSSSLSQVNVAQPQQGISPILVPNQSTRATFGSI